MRIVAPERICPLGTAIRAGLHQFFSPLQIQNLFEVPQQSLQLENTRKPSSRVFPSVPVANFFICHASKNFPQERAGSFPNSFLFSAALGRFPKGNPMSLRIGGGKINASYSDRRSLYSSLADSKSASRSRDASRSRKSSSRRANKSSEADSNSRFVSTMSRHVE